MKWNILFVLRRSTNWCPYFFPIRMPAAYLPKTSKRLTRGLLYVFSKNQIPRKRSGAVLRRSLCTQQCLIGCVFWPELSLRDTTKAVGQTSTGSICDAGQEGEAQQRWLRFSGKPRAGEADELKGNIMR